MRLFWQPNPCDNWEFVCFRNWPDIESTCFKSIESVHYHCPVCGEANGFCKICVPKKSCSSSGRYLACFGKL